MVPKFDLLQANEGKLQISAVLLNLLACLMSEDALGVSVTSCTCSPSGLAVAIFISQSVQVRAALICVQNTDVVILQTQNLFVCPSVLLS